MTKSELRQYNFSHVSHKYQTPRLMNLKGIKKQYLPGTKNTGIKVTRAGYPGGIVLTKPVKPQLPTPRGHQDTDKDGIPDRHDPRPYGPWWQDPHRHLWPQPNGRTVRNPFTRW
ncbi:hypothetical protein Pse7367_2464 [Thalassoporum mexicanum PCC 7367]|nr:hypothetical protein Pse7367_2464 [Pseudanabaena sp. PCC 7367]